MQEFSEATERFVDWLDAQVTHAGRGDATDKTAVAPSASLWLGRLASEDEVTNSLLGARAERLDPCAIGIRVRPQGPPPWSLTATARCRVWIKHDPGTASDPAQPWERSSVVEVSVHVVVDSDKPEVSEGESAFATKLATAGATGMRALVRVEVQTWQGQPELVVQMINTTPQKVQGLTDNHLYECELDVTGIATVPFELEALPDTFRYDRAVPAYGINVGVIPLPGAPGGFRTVDTVAVTTRRPVYWNSPLPEPDLSFQTLSRDPLPQLQALVDALRTYNDEHWSPVALQSRQEAEGWSAGVRDEADGAAADARAEADRLAYGLHLLGSNETLLRCFTLMNQAIEISANGKYPGWRPFQIGFLLGSLAFLVDPEEASIVDTVWFATGGGKTETYLGLLVTAAFHDRLTGKSSGVTAWSRFPLRLLSLQQTQRFADALGGAELVRRRNRISGAPFSLGFLVGSGGAPNKIAKSSTAFGQVDPDSPGMPDKYQVLLRCPFCHGSDVHMHFDRRAWRLTHQCRNQDCPWQLPDLPVYIVDEEIYRYLPTVVLGTLDKAASVGMQAAMRGLVGPPLGLCVESNHGYTYAPRGPKNKGGAGCLVPDCVAGRSPLPMASDRYAPTLRLQDELHLLRDSLGAVDSHYESLLDHLQTKLGGPIAKIVASSATLTGYERQVHVLYQRVGRVFPQPGPMSRESFWSCPGPMPLRRFVAVAPRGTTLDFVSDRTLDVLQASIRTLRDDPDAVCEAAGVDTTHAARLLDIYGTDVVYGTTLYDVEAAARSLATNTTSGGIQAVQLTGQTDFEEVRSILERLENPEPNFDDRIHVVAASSMLSHGVDVARLNTMVMLGLPLSTAEFIQTTARVGRTFPGLVHVLHKIGRERDAATFRSFEHFVLQGDRFVEPIPITRRSRRVLRLTMPGLVEARRLALMEPAATAQSQRLTTLTALRDYATDSALDPADQSALLADLLGFYGQEDELLRKEIWSWMDDWFSNLRNPATTAKWPNELGATAPMRSLRDVEVAVPIFEQTARR